MPSGGQVGEETGEDLLLLYADGAVLHRGGQGRVPGGRHGTARQGRVRGRLEVGGRVVAPRAPADAGVDGGGDRGAAPVEVAVVGELRAAFGEEFQEAPDRR